MKQQLLDMIAASNEHEAIIDAFMTWLEEEGFDEIPLYHRLNAAVVGLTLFRQQCEQAAKLAPEPTTTP